MTAETAPAPETPAAGMSELGRLTGVLFDPKPAFADIVARPRWVVPLILLSLLSIVYMYLFSQRVGWERYMRKVIESSPRTESLTAEQREQVIQRQVPFAQVMGYVGAVAGPAIFALAVGGVLLFVANVVLGGQLRFKQTFGITCYASVIGVISTPLAILMMHLKIPDDFDVQNPTAFNIGAYLDPETTSKWVVSVASSVDLFTFWEMALLATGLSVAVRKLSFGRAFCWVAAPWAVYVVLKAGWTALFS